MTDDVAGKTMVVGLAFHAGRVLMVRKKRPKWQAGLWNGVGGVVEDGEKPLHAMTREFCEETGHLTQPIMWTHFCTENETFGAVVHFYWMRFPDSAPSVEVPRYNDAGEELAWLLVSHLGIVEVLGNLRWLVPLAQDWRGTAHPVVVSAVGDIRKRASW